jgi:hypothetical protein
MESRADVLIRTLGLAPHPEGGFYREIFRSPLAVRPADGRPGRAAVTAIHFLLVGGGHSRWHRLVSDEFWVHLEGEPVDLWLLRGAPWELEHVRLGGPGGEGVALRVVPAGTWQAAAPSGAYGLVACFVAPGFEFDDESFMAPESVEAGVLRARWPALAGLI